MCHTLFSLFPICLLCRIVSFTVETVLFTLPRKWNLRRFRCFALMVGAEK